MPLEPPFRVTPNGEELAVYLAQVGVDHPEKLVFPLRDGRTHVQLADLANLPPVLGPHAGWSPLDTAADLVAWGVALVLLAAFGALVLMGLFRGRGALDRLIAEPDGKASLSRFQALVFTFAFVVAFMTIVLRTGAFPPTVPWELMVILGGSLGTYLWSKHLSQEHEAEVVALAPAPSRLLWHAPGATVPGPFGDALIRPTLGSQAPPRTTIQLRALPTTPGPEDYRVIAVAVGTVGLVVNAKLPAGHGARCLLRYTDESGQLVDRVQDDGPLTITTFQDAVSEVAAAIVSERPGEPIAVEVRLV